MQGKIGIARKEIYTYRGNKMTANEMAKATGWSLHTVYKYARLGVIKSTKVAGKNIDFDESGVEILNAMRKAPIKIEKEPEQVTAKPRKPTLREKVAELVEYNKKNDTYYSYGYATAYNII